MVVYGVFWAADRNLFAIQRHNIVQLLFVYAKYCLQELAGAGTLQSFYAKHLPFLKVKSTLSTSFFSGTSGSLTLTPFTWKQISPGAAFRGSCLLPRHGPPSTGSVGPGPGPPIKRFQRTCRQRNTVILSARRVDFLHLVCNVHNATAAVFELFHNPE